MADSMELAMETERPELVEPAAGLVDTADSGSEANHRVIGTCSFLLIRYQ